MNRLTLLMLCLDVLCIIHVFKRHRDRFWIWVIVLLPFAGSLAYAIVELRPEAMAWLQRGNRSTKPEAFWRPPPEKTPARSKGARDAWSILREKGMDFLAKEQYRRALTVFDVALRERPGDPETLLAAAEAHAALNEPAQAKERLDRLRDANPGYQSVSGHFLYARSLADMGQKEMALEEYRALTGYASGEEARCRCALLLRDMGRETEAQPLFAEILEHGRMFGQDYRRAQREWLEIALRYAAAPVAGG